jgi:hypothetical protein
LKLKATLDSVSSYFSFKRSVLGGVNVGLIGSTYTPYLGGHGELLRHHGADARLVGAMDQGPRRAAAPQLEIEKQNLKVVNHVLDSSP